MTLSSIRSCVILCQVLVLVLIIPECNSGITDNRLFWRVRNSDIVHRLISFIQRLTREIKTALKNYVSKRLHDECVHEVNAKEESLDKYIYLRQLQNQKEEEFYKCLIRNVDKMLPIIYTPVVGKACKNYKIVEDRGGKRGLTLNIRDHKGNIEKTLEEWKKQQAEVKAIVVTDGERILGLGDLGANGMGIPVGKLALYTALGGVHPKFCLPITLDVGTNNKRYLTDKKEKYVGLQMTRVTGDDYYDFIEEFITSVVKVYGRNTLIQFEDFANPTAYPLLQKYRDRYTVFNDDIQGTAAVTLAGILSAAKFRKTSINDAKVLFVGAGSAALGIGTLIAEAMDGEVKDNYKKIYMKDVHGLLTSDHCEFPEDDHRRNFCHKVEEGNNVKDLDEMILWLKPNILIGVSGVKGLFTEAVLSNMAKVNEHKPSPIIMPLSNPTSKSECTAEDAYKYAKGCLFASGSPFAPVFVDEEALDQRGTMKSWVKSSKSYGKKFKPMQCNNDNIFPGVALGIILAQMNTVPNKVFLIAAKTLAYKCVRHSDFKKGSLYPKLDELRDCSVNVAAAVVEYAFKEGLSALQPMPPHWKTWSFNDYKYHVQKYQYYPGR